MRVTFNTFLAFQNTVSDLIFQVFQVVSKITLKCMKCCKLGFILPLKSNCRQVVVLAQLEVIGEAVCSISRFLNAPKNVPSVRKAILEFICPFYKLTAFQETFDIQIEPFPFLSLHWPNVCSFSDGMASMISLPGKTGPRKNVYLGS